MCFCGKEAAEWKPCCWDLDLWGQRTPVTMSLGSVSLAALPGPRAVPWVRAAAPSPEQGRVLVQWGPALGSAGAPGDEPAEA